MTPASLKDKCTASLSGCCVLLFRHCINNSRALARSQLLSFGLCKPVISRFNTSSRACDAHGLRASTGQAAAFPPFAGNVAWMENCFAVSANRLLRTVFPEIFKQLRRPDAAGFFQRPHTTGNNHVRKSLVAAGLPDCNAGGW
jgi:hypothetical protein